MAAIESRYTASLAGLSLAVIAVVLAYSRALQIKKEPVKRTA
jgi:hypothetical protein